MKTLTAARCGCAVIDGKKNKTNNFPWKNSRKSFLLDGEYEKLKPPRIPTYSHGHQSPVGKERGRKARVTEGRGRLTKAGGSFV